LEEVGNALGLSRQEVRAIEAAAFKRLKTDPNLG
jgi:DNA-directed RNA polymerase sigma subunit (sigma70/sigma32)